MLKDGDSSDPKSIFHASIRTIGPQEKKICPLCRGVQYVLALIEIRNLLLFTELEYRVQAKQILEYDYILILL